MSKKQGAAIHLHIGEKNFGSPGLAGHPAMGPGMPPGPGAPPVLPAGLAGGAPPIPAGGLPAGPPPSLPGGGAPAPMPGGGLTPAMMSAMSGHPPSAFPISPTQFPAMPYRARGGAIGEGHHYPPYEFGSQSGMGRKEESHEQARRRHGE
jgi:hypothetical protein